ncbi:MAG: hypothetical protein WC872_01740 [Candidatus Absconditabacterales bacterium]
MKKNFLILGLFAFLVLAGCGTKIKNVSQDLLYTGNQYDNPIDQIQNSDIQSGYEGVQTNDGVVQISKEELNKKVDALIEETKIKSKNATGLTEDDIDLIEKVIDEVVQNSSTGTKK